MKYKIFIILFILCFNFIYSDSKSQGFGYLQLFDAGTPPDNCQLLQIGFYWYLEQTDYIVLEKFDLEHNTTSTYTISVGSIYYENPVLPGFLIVYEGRWRITATAYTNNNVFITRNILVVDFDPDKPRVYTKTNSWENNIEAVKGHDNWNCHNSTWSVNLLRNSVIVDSYQFQPEEDFHIFTGLSPGNYLVKFYYDNIFYSEWWDVVWGFSPKITEPQAWVKWISGETFNIQWQDIQWQNINLKCITNFETSIESELIIDGNIQSSQNQYSWQIPDSTFSYRSKIIIENAANPAEFIVGEEFRIKPYHLTKVIVDPSNNNDSRYYEFQKNRDQWGFKNSESDMFPPQWRSQFNYKREKDPFTLESYTAGYYVQAFIFNNANELEHPDWVSWVNTFTPDVCYKKFENGVYSVYSPIAVSKWRDEKENWIGSCFGIATANAIVFRNIDQFRQRYPTFPSFVDPITVTSNNAVKKRINELYTHQFGQPHSGHDKLGRVKNPNQTLDEIKTMLLSDNDPLRALSMYNNGGTGAHTINVYKVTRDVNNPDHYHLHVYDNDVPTSPQPIVINTVANGGSGSWSYYHKPTWGGFEKLFLEEPAVEYLTNPTLSRPGGEQRPFVLSEGILQIFSSADASISIKDNNGNITGYINNTIHTDIPESTPLIRKNGSESPPYGYELPVSNYSVTLNQFTEETTNADFYIDNKLYSFERFDANQTQTDRLYFDGKLNFTNPDNVSKNIKFINIINEQSQEKVFAVSNLLIHQNDSVKIENPDEDNLKLTSSGPAKIYTLELNLAASTGLGRFRKDSIHIPSNSSQLLKPEWSDDVIEEVVILLDSGNNGSIDDSITILNEPPVTLNLTALIQGFYSNLANKMVNDVAEVYLRSVQPPFTVIDSSSLLIDSLGKGKCEFQNALNNTPYYIVVKHRNSIETWSSSGQSFTSNSLNYDFTTSANKAFGNNLILKGSKYCIYNGDINQNGNIDAQDLSSVENDVFNFVTGYVNTDITGDNVVDAADLVIIDNNAFNFVSRITPP